MKAGFFSKIIDRISFFIFKHTREDQIEITVSILSVVSVVFGAILYVFWRGGCYPGGILNAIIEGVVAGFVITLILTLPLTFLWDKLISLVFLVLSGISGKKFEDITKIGSAADFEGIVKRYEKYADFISYGDDKSGENKLPVICCCFFPDHKIEGIEVFDKGEMYEAPPIITQHFEKIMKAHRHSETMNNNVCIRVDDAYFDKDKKVFVLKTSRTKYFDSMTTNRAINYSFLSNGKQKWTIREILEPGPIFSDLKDSCLSNHLGYNGFIETKEGYIIFVRRNKDLSIGKNCLGCSLEAAIATTDCLDSSKVFNMDGLLNGAAASIRRELEMEKDDFKYSLSHQDIIAFYRDAVEGGKPQFLFYIKLEETFSTINDRYLARQKKEEKRCSSDGIKNTPLIKIKRENIETLEGISFGINHIKIDGKILEQEKLEEIPMMPSAIASILMLQKYLQGFTKE